MSNLAETVAHVPLGVLMEALVEAPDAKDVQLIVKDGGGERFKFGVMVVQDPALWADVVAASEKHTPADYETHRVELTRNTIARVHE